MVSRADQVAADRFWTRRLVNAIAVGEPSRSAASANRGSGPLLAGALLTAVLLAAVVGYSWVRSPDTSWRADDTIVIERETGAVFVVRHGLLHPVLNYASARLAVGSRRSSQAIVARADLAGVPRGSVWGIAGAPDSLPARSDLLTGGIAACTRRGVQSADPPIAIGRGHTGIGGGQVGANSGPTGVNGGHTVIESVVYAGAAAPPFPAEELGDSGVLVEDGSHRRYVLWRDRRHPIDAGAGVLAALGWGTAPIVSVPSPVLDNIELGQPLRAPSLPPEALGRPSPLPGIPIGQIVSVRNYDGVTQFGVMLAGGVADITQVQANLIAADRNIANTVGLRSQPMTLTIAEYSAAAHARSLVPSGVGPPPARTPTLTVIDETGGVCLSYPDGAAASKILIARRIGRLAGEVNLDNRSKGLSRWAWVPPGRAMLVDVAGVVLITDLGQCFPIGSPAALAAMGLDGGPVDPVPVALLSLLDAGPVLDVGPIVESRDGQGG